MSQAEILRKEPYMKYYSPEEINKMCLQVADFVSKGKRNEASILLKEIPLLPKSAKIMKEMFGCKHVIESGYNLIEVVEEFGHDWLKQ